MIIEKKVMTEVLTSVHVCNKCKRDDGRLLYSRKISFVNTQMDVVIKEAVAELCGECHTLVHRGLTDLFKFGDFKPEGLR